MAPASSSLSLRVLFGQDSLDLGANAVNHVLGCTLRSHQATPGYGIKACESLFGNDLDVGNHIHLLE